MPRLRAGSYPLSVSEGDLPLPLPVHGNLDEGRTVTNPQYTAIALVIDCSGSMSHLKTEVEQSVNAFIGTRKTEAGQRSMMITTFSDVVHLMPSVSVEHIMPFRMVIGGMTALYDAIGETVQRLGMELYSLHEDVRPGHVIVAIFTDGYENSSQLWTSAAINKLISQQRDDYSWEFLYMGANQDAILEANKIGIPSRSSVTYNTSRQGTRSVINTMDAYVASAAAGITPEVTEQQRKEAQQ